MHSVHFSVCCIEEMATLQMMKHRGVLEDAVMKTLESIDALGNYEDDAGGIVGRAPAAAVSGGAPTPRAVRRPLPTFG